MEVLGGIFFLVIGGFAFARPGDLLARIRRDRFNRRFMAWVDNTAYGRWFARYERPWMRVMGVLFVVVGAATVASGLA